MRKWRMALRVGNGGTSLWPICLKNGVAAITYTPLVNTDLSTVAYNAPEDLWAQLQGTQKASLRRVAYEMKKGDIIYVKEGTSIVGKGVVASEYFFDYEKSIIDENNLVWPHQVRVDWQNDFPEVTNFQSGGEQVTVFELPEESAAELEDRATSEADRLMNAGFAEGERQKAEINFRIRNTALIKAKKDLSNGNCEVCGFNFSDRYGQIGSGFIEAHHIEPISKGPRSNTLADIALVCSNCHSMIHKKNPPYSVKELASIIRE